MSYSVNNEVARRVLRAMGSRHAQQERNSFWSSAARRSDGAPRTAGWPKSKWKAVADKVDKWPHRDGGRRNIRQAY